MDFDFPWASSLPQPDSIYQAYLNDLHTIITKHPYVLRYPQEVYRGVLLATCSILDKTLLDMFSRTLVQDKEQYGQMFGELGPLGTYGARARLGYLLGYYSKLVFDEMMTVGKIRNRMAHEPDVYNLDHARVRDLQKKLTIFNMVLAKREHWPKEAEEAMVKIKAAGWDENTKEYHFLFSVVFLIAIVNKSPLPAVVLPSS